MWGWEKVNVCDKIFITGNVASRSSRPRSEQFLGSMENLWIFMRRLLLIIVISAASGKFYYPPWNIVWKRLVSLRGFIDELCSITGSHFGTVLWVECALSLNASEFALKSRALRWSNNNMRAIDSLLNSLLSADLREHANWVKSLTTLLANGARYWHKFPSQSIFNMPVKRPRQ